MSREEGARSAAVSFLSKLFRQPVHIDALSQDPGFLELDSRDRRLVTELVYGVLRNRSLLDYYISGLSQKPLTELDALVVWILRLALYQLEFLRIPDHAAVHGAVELCRQFRKGRATGFVNAILRAYLRLQPSPPPGDSAKALAVRFSHPEWLVKRYLRRYGPSRTEELLRRNNQPPVPSVWVNVFKSSLDAFYRRLEEEEIEYELCPGVSACVVVRAPGFIEHPLYREGFCFFMDVGSQEIADLAPLENRLLLGDFCAAPGGKAFILASRKSENARLYCADANFRRLAEMRKRAGLYEISGLEFVNADAAAGVPFRTTFDFILLDVPCTGLGTVRSNPDIRWRVRAQELERFHSLQLRLLANGFAALRPGGEVLYATCSTEPEENESVVGEFLDREPAAELVGDLHRTFPEPHPGDCFFAARIRRTSL